MTSSCPEWTKGVLSPFADRSWATAVEVGTPGMCRAAISPRVSPWATVTVTGSGEAPPAFATPTPVATASTVQVREGIHTRGIGAWQRYAEPLQPVHDWLRERLPASAFGAPE